jgi:hypothetical protein
MSFMLGGSPCPHRLLKPCCTRLAQPSRILPHPQSRRRLLLVDASPQQNPSGDDASMDALAAALSREAARMRRAMSDEELRASMDGEEVKDGFAMLVAACIHLTRSGPSFQQVVSQHVAGSPVTQKMSPELQALVLASLGDGGLTPDDFEVCIITRQLPVHRISHARAQTLGGCHASMYYCVTLHPCGERTCALASSHAQIVQRLGSISVQDVSVEAGTGWAAGAVGSRRVPATCSGEMPRHPTLISFAGS